MTRPIAVVTGASRGIGRAIALRLAGDHDIVAVARSRDQLESLAAEIATLGGRCEIRPVDITDAGAVTAGLDGVEATVLVNDAGAGTIKPLMELTRDEWRGMVDLNFNALYDVTRAVLPAMIARGAGHIINIGSISGRSAFVGGSCYAATKHAVMGFSECLMLELRGAGIKVSVVNPGSVDTGFSSGNRADWKLAPEDVANAVAAVVATPPDVLIFNVEIRTLTAPPRK